MPIVSTRSFILNHLKFSSLYVEYLSRYKRPGKLDPEMQLCNLMKKLVNSRTCRLLCCPVCHLRSGRSLVNISAFISLSDGSFSFCSLS